MEPTVTYLKGTKWIRLSNAPHGGSYKKEINGEMAYIDRRYYRNRGVVKRHFAIIVNDKYLGTRVRFKDAVILAEKKR